NARRTRFESSSCCLLAGGWVISLPCSSPRSCGLNQFEKENNPNVRNKHAYPVHRQNNAGGIGASTNPAGNYNPCPNPSRCSRGGSGRDPEPPPHRRRN